MLSEYYIYCLSEGPYFLIDAAKLDISRCVRKQLVLQMNDLPFIFDYRQTR